jgi:nitroreductase
LQPGALAVSAIDFLPAIHPVFFIHRITGLEPGLYVLARSPEGENHLREAMESEWEWLHCAEAPEPLRFYRLAAGDAREAAKALCCHQTIAADGAFTIAMLAEFEPRLREFGASEYRRMHWEAGALGQALYLEAGAAGLSGTGIGCFFDDAVHELLGLKDRRFQTIYHFTVGGALEDSRLQTLPAYFHLQTGERPKPV